ncbi:MAG TPA: signal peptidase I [Clostridiales bacterium]|nr:signal peptidase I [Clostridiales bacterium]
MSDKKTELIEWIQAIIIALVLSIIIKTFIFEVILVDGYSMFPTLHERDRIIVNKLAYRISTPKRGDIVIFRNPGNMKQNYIKRVIGVPGDRIEIRDGTVFVNGEAIQEDYIYESPLTDFQEEVVPKDTIFVLGDNRNFSKDSRDPSVGFVPLENVLGKAKIRIWPLTDITIFE